jgi:hypothetical protein
MPQRKRLEDELREVWAEWSAPPDYGLWHEHKETTTVEKAEEAIGLKAKVEAAPEPIDVAPASVGGGGASAAASSRAAEEKEWGEKPTGPLKAAREKSANGLGGYVRRGRTLERTPAKPRQTSRSVSFTSPEHFKEISEMIKQAAAESVAARNERLTAARVVRAAKKEAAEKLKADKSKVELLPNTKEVKKRKKRAPKKAPESVPA